MGLMGERALIAVRPFRSLLVAIEKIPDLAMVAPSEIGGRRNYAQSHLLKGEVARGISPMFTPSLVRSCYFLLR
jgi:hypothetical protein